MTSTTGLYKNGSRWWMRVRNSSSLSTPRSTGTADIKLALRIRNMVAALQESYKLHDLLDAAAAGKLPLLTLYNHYAAGTINTLREDQRRESTEGDVEPWVERWRDEVLKARVSNNQIGQASADDYYRQVRAIIPEGAAFPASKFTEEHLGRLITALAVSGSTKRRYVAALRLFYRYAKKRVPIPGNPFDDAEWMPKDNPSREDKGWDHATRVNVLSKVSNPEFKAALSLMLGSGIELGALVRLQARHINEDRTVVVPGTKNEARRDRTVFVDKWAWAGIDKWADTMKPWEPLFPNIDEDGGNLRDAFYEAQVAAGVISKPERSETTRKLLWKAARPHTLHDCRHTWEVIRLLGLDGEPKQDLKFCSLNLGHANEQMDIRIYGKANIAERLRRMEKTA